MTIKCENCGANLQQNPEKAIAFCPYCGFAVKQPEDLVDLAKYTMTHEETVREKKVKEEKKTNRNLLIGFAVTFAAMFILWQVFLVIPHKNNMAKLDTLIDEIHDDITNSRFDEAELKLTKLRLEDDYSSDDDAKYRKIREDLAKLINERKH